MTLKGNFPYAVAHWAQSHTVAETVEYARGIALSTLTLKEAKEYVRACTKTGGNLNLLNPEEDKS